MGFDISFFLDVIHEDVICPMCEGVADHPIQGPCEHLFCTSCIPDKRKYVCPFDGTVVRYRLPANRAKRNTISNLRIRCQFYEFGCTEIIKLDKLLQHLESCKYNPDLLISCRRGCGFTSTKSEVEDHNCIRDLQMAVKSLQRELDEERDKRRWIAEEFKESQKDLRMIKRHLQFKTKPVIESWV